jgi:hypothetical protein
MDRDYLTEMDLVLDEAISATDDPRAIIAAKLRARLDESDPDLLAGWLHEKAEDILTEELGLRERVERSKNFRRVGARSFANAAKEAEDGQPEALGTFALKFVVDEENNRRAIADMTGPDHLYVASRHASRANREQMLAAFHNAVAKKVGDKRTADVMGEEQYEALYRSIVGPESDAA